MIRNKYNRIPPRFFDLITTLICKDQKQNIYIKNHHKRNDKDIILFLDYADNNCLFGKIDIKSYIKINVSND